MCISPVSLSSHSSKEKTPASTTWHVTEASEGMPQPRVRAFPLPQPPLRHLSTCTAPSGRPSNAHSRLSFRTDFKNHLFPQTLPRHRPATQRVMFCLTARLHPLSCLVSPVRTASSPTDTQSSVPRNIPHIRASWAEQGLHNRNVPRDARPGRT